MSSLFNLNTLIYIVCAISIAFALYSYKMAKYNLTKTIMNVGLSILIIVSTYLTSSSSASVFLTYLIVAPFVLCASLYYLWYTDLRKK
jgi:hypothetical protein